MSNEEHTLRPEDYREPACVFCTDFFEPGKPTVTPIPISRVIARLDEDLDRNDYAAAERHLDYWLREAELGNDLRGALSLQNERMGLYRKMNRQTEALACMETALALLRQTGLEETVTAGTTLLNAATVCKAFGQPERALALYEQAQGVYEAMLPPEDSRRGGLYNNMALALTDLGRFSEARDCYGKALEVMRNAPNGALEQAITQLNLANLCEAERGLLDGEAEIEQRLTLAEQLLETETLPHNGYYAFVCEKCAPTFRYYGRFAYAQELTERAGKIYAGN